MSELCPSVTELFNNPNPELSPEKIILPCVKDSRVQVNESTHELVANMMRADAIEFKGLMLDHDVEPLVWVQRPININKYVGMRSSGFTYYSGLRNSDFKETSLTWMVTANYDTITSPRKSYQRDVNTQGFRDLDEAHTATYYGGLALRRNGALIVYKAKGPWQLIPKPSGDTMFGKTPAKPIPVTQYQKIQAPDMTEAFGTEEDKGIRFVLGADNQPGDLVLDREASDEDIVKRQNIDPSLKNAYASQPAILKWRLHLANLALTLCASNAELVHQQ